MISLRITRKSDRANCVVISLEWQPISEVLILVFFWVMVELLHVVSNETVWYIIPQEFKNPAKSKLSIPVFSIVSAWLIVSIILTVVACSPSTHTPWEGDVAWKGFGTYRVQILPYDGSKDRANN